MKSGRKKDTVGKGHRELTDRGAGLDEHARLAKFGAYAELRDEALRVLSAIGLALRAKEAADAAKPGATEEYDRMMAVIGKFLIECMEKPRDGGAILRAVADALEAANRNGFTLIEMPSLVLPELFGRAVKVSDALKMASERGLEVPRVPDSVPIDRMRQTLALEVGFVQAQDPNHLFTVKELRGFFGRRVQGDFEIGHVGPVPSERTIRRAARELGIPLVGPGAPKGTKQGRVRRQNPDN